MATVSSSHNSNTTFTACLIDSRFGFDMDESLSLAPNFWHQISEANSLVDKMPCVSVSVSTEEDDVCSVCMEDFRSDSDHFGGKQVLCGHIYHASCISSWLTHSNSCPLCRFNISSTAGARR